MKDSTRFIGGVLPISGNSPGNNIAMNPPAEGGFIAMRQNARQRVTYR